RRVQFNGSGTDHGTASSLFVIGNKVRGGLYGQQPSLTDLDRNGNLKVQVDFRSVYASVLDSWLKADSKQILGAQYENLGLFAGDPVSAPAPPPIITPPATAPASTPAQADPTPVAAAAT